MRLVRDIYTSASLIFNCARRRRGRQQNRKRCSQDAEQNRCATRRIHSGRAAMYPVFDHKKRKPRARSERVPHLPLDTAVPPLTSAASPTRKGGDWVFALSPRERASFLISAPWVRPKIRVNISARLTTAGLMPAKICAAFMVMRGNLPHASGRSAKPGDCTV